MELLYLITARGGSKGIPFKNIKPLAGKPLIHYSLDVAMALATKEDICVSTDDDEIRNVVEAYGVSVPFKRPAELATDKSGSYEVIRHALDFYKSKGKQYDAVVLLQPTSPFRKAVHVKEALALYGPSLDMVASVKEAEANPYYNLFEENGESFLKLSKESSAVRRQDAPKVHQFNGAVYIINTASLNEHSSLSEFPRVKKYLMSRNDSLDLDTPEDWALAEMLLEKNFVKL